MYYSFHYIKVRYLTIANSTFHHLAIAVTSKQLTKILYIIHAHSYIAIPIQVASYMVFLTTQKINTESATNLATTIFFNVIITVLLSTY